jgi:hypothetical protein
MFTECSLNVMTGWQVGSTVFAHGGLKREHIEYGLERMNSETSAWMRRCASMHTIIIKIIIIMIIIMIMIINYNDTNNNNNNKTIIIRLW